MNRWTALGIAFLLASSCWAQDTGSPFTDGPNGAKVHTASGLVCPAAIGAFERDAVGERDPQNGVDYCAYSALDGVYGTITVMPLPDSYDPVSVLAPEIAVQEGTGGRIVGEDTRTLGTKAVPLSVYTRTYETARLQAMQYRSLFASAAVGAWAIQVTVEYADPRDRDLEEGFLAAAYAAAAKKIGAPSAP